MPSDKVLRRSLDHLTRALEVVAKTGDHSAAAILNGHMGCCRLALGAKKEAFSNFEKALKESQRVSVDATGQQAAASQAKGPAHMSLC